MPYKAFGEGCFNELDYTDKIIYNKERLEAVRLFRQE